MDTIAKNNKKNYFLGILIIIAFIIFNGLAVAKEHFEFLLLPFALLILFYAIYAADKLLIFITLLVPLSIPLSEYYPSLGVDLALPTEPIIIGLMILFLLRLIYVNDYDKQIMSHPVSKVIIFSLLWILITAISSTMPIVSIKFFLSRLWFVVVFFYLNALWFKENKNFKIFIWLYSISLSIVVIYTFQKHLSYGLLDQQAANFTCNPFYKDHTAYGAALAMIIFPVFYFVVGKNISLIKRIIALIFFSAFLFALIFSYSRAAWLSVAGAIVVGIIILLKIKFKHLALSTIIILAAGTLIYNQLMDDLEKNKQDSSGDFEKHLQSMYNVKTDASNVERINRWACALRMFNEKPLLGWGPGTYQFKYAPFQLSYQKTIISTNTGDRGNAHSEYLGPLAEQGIIGLLAVFLILIYSIYTGLKAYKYAESSEVKWLAFFTILGLITYFIHGLLNDFLDTDKLSILFWGYIAYLTVANLYFSKNVNNEKLL